MPVNKDAYYELQRTFLEKEIDLSEHEKAVLLMMAAFSKPDGDMLRCAPCDVTIEEFLEMFPLFVEDIALDPQEILEGWETILAESGCEDAVR